MAMHARGTRRRSRRAPRRSRLCALHVELPTAGNTRLPFENRADLAIRLVERRANFARVAVMVVMLVHLRIFWLRQLGSPPPGPTQQLPIFPQVVSACYVVGCQP